MNKGLLEWAKQDNKHFTDDPQGEDKLFSFGEIIESIKNEIIYVEM